MLAATLAGTVLPFDHSDNRIVPLSVLGPWYTEHEGGQGLGEVCQESWVVEEGGDGAEHTFKVWWIATPKQFFTLFTF